MNDRADTWIDATIAATRDVTPTVREFTLRPDHGASWTVGSHLRVQIEPDGGAGEVRHYSLIGTPVPGAPWRIAVKRVNPSRGGSAWMWTRRVGEELRVAAPRNHFELPLGAAQTLIVAGGIGITPLVGMALTLAARRADVQMLYAARSDEELAYADDLRTALGDRLATFASSRGQRIDLRAAIGGLQPGAQMLVCGPHTLLESARNAWRDAGREPARLRFENFGSGGSHAAQPFRVELPRHGLAFDVGTDTTLLEALESHGVPMLSDCLRGECGLCAIDVLSATAEIDHRDLFLDAAQRAAGNRLCACVSRARGGTLVLDSAYRHDTETRR